MDGNNPIVSIEACVDSVESALIAEASGVDRVELCANLVEGGTTPSRGSIELAVERLTIPCFVMIRTRGGDFCYSEDELSIMLRDVETAKNAGAAGVVFGCLVTDGTVNRHILDRVIDCARPMGVTFHRAFDMTRDPFEALGALISSGVDRVLTSGQQANAIDGLDLIKALVLQAGDALSVMPGGGISADNVQTLITATGAKEVHVYTERRDASSMSFRNTQVLMGRRYDPDEYVRTLADANAFGRMVSAIRS